MTKKYNLVFILLAFIIGIFQFVLIKDTRIDGDAMNLMVNEYQQEILNHKFGLQNIGTEIKYSNSNRYIGFISERFFFYSFDHIYQYFKNNISRHEFIYYYITFAKLFIQFILALLLSILMSKSYKILPLNILIATLLMQHFAFYDQIGIIDHAITYVFFYAFTMIGHLLLLLLLKYRSHKFKITDTVLFLVLSWLTVFSGSINYAIHIILIPLLFLYISKNSDSKLLRITLVISWIFGFISLLVGFQNNETVEQIGILSRYLLSIKGYIRILTINLGWFCLILFLLFQFYFWRKLGLHIFNNRVLLLIFIFMILYGLLIPFGGYRPYRPFIIRYDVMIPISLASFGLILYLNQILLDIQLYRKGLFVFCVLLLVFQFIKPYTPNNFEEKSLLKKIEISMTRTILIKEGSQLLVWDKLEKRQEKDLNNFLKVLGFINQNQEVKIN